MWYNIEVVSKESGNRSRAKKIKSFFQKAIDKPKKLWYNNQVVGESREYDGSIAQLGEHLPYKQRVIGSSPIVSTKRSGSSVG